MLFDTNAFYVLCFCLFFLVRWWTLANYPYLPELLSSGRGFLNAFQWTHQCHPLARCSFSWNPPRVFPLYRFLQVTVAQKEKQPSQTGSPQICIVTASHKQPQNCGSPTGVLHRIDSHNTWDAFWPQKAALDTENGTNPHHDGTKITVQTCKRSQKHIFSNQLVNTACVYRNYSLWLKYQFWN